MKALGMVETKGIIGAIEASDVALKTANVNLTNMHMVKAGLVCVEFSGDVGAIKVAVEAAEEATKRLGVFISSNVIARPDEDIKFLIEDTKKENTEAESVTEIESDINTENESDDKVVAEKTEVQEVRQADHTGNKRTNKKR